MQERLGEAALMAVEVLAQIAADDTDNLGDLSTLADPTVVTKLIESHKAENKEIA